MRARERGYVTFRERGAWYVSVRKMISDSNLVLKYYKIFISMKKLQKRTLITYMKDFLNLEGVLPFHRIARLLSKE